MMLLTTYIFPHYYAKVEVDSYDSLSVEKRSIMLYYSLSQFAIKIKITTTIINFQKNSRMKQLKNNDNFFF